MKHSTLLAGQCAILFGATAGIGLACAKGLAQAGASDVFIVGRNKERGEIAARNLQERASYSRVQFIQADACSVEGVNRAVNFVIEHIGRIDVMFSSAAGTPMPSPLLLTPPDSIEASLTQPLLGAILPTRAVLPFMKEQRAGVIITVASDAAKVATPGESVVGAAMAGIVTFTRTVAMEAKRYGVRANCITPSAVRSTPLFAELQSSEFFGRIIEALESKASLGLAEPEDLAHLTVFLASSLAAKITGQAISPNGGISAA